MKIGQFRPDHGEIFTGAVRTDGSVINVVEAGEGAGLDLPSRFRSLIEEWRWQQKVEMAVEYAREADAGLYEASNLTPCAPVTGPSKVIGVGLNYRDHAEESGLDIPEHPVLFSKYPSALTGPESDITWAPELTSKVDYEAELVVVIGKRARNVDQENVSDFVAGYTIGNDVSARDLQFEGEQWVHGKSLDTFAPIGPSIVTPDELADPHDLSIWSEVNGDRVQESNTSNLIFDIDDLVSFCSRSFTLLPGDLIFTGTPAGVGIFREPPLLLQDGDSVTVGIEGLGELTNRCATRSFE